MISARIQILLWIFLWIFWIFISQDHHPELLLDVIVTTILLTGYSPVGSVAAFYNADIGCIGTGNYCFIYLQFLFFIKKFRRRYLLYLLSSIVSGSTIIFAALAAIRFMYSQFGYAADLGDYWENFGIDSAGLIIHLLGAALLMYILNRKDYGRTKLFTSE